MPHYFFNMVEGDGRDAVRDSDGVVLSDAGAARKKAAGLARDIVRHGFQEPIESWKIVVTDESGEQVLSLALSEIPAGSIWNWFESRSLIARCKRLFGVGPAARFAAAAGLGIVIQAGLLTVLMVMNETGKYQTASAPTSDAIVAVRFVGQASPEAIGEFLERYKAAIIDSPRAGGFYRLRFTDPHLPKEELTKTVTRMMRESIVELAAAVE